MIFKPNDMVQGKDLVARHFGIGTHMVMSSRRVVSRLKSLRRIVWHHLYIINRKHYLYKNGQQKKICCRTISLLYVFCNCPCYITELSGNSMIIFLTWQLSASQQSLSVIFGKEHELGVVT
jgi:hypothetical protein